MSAKNLPNELSISRIYDAPARLVWEAWTNEKHVAKWWGPRGFSITTKSKDTRIGGKWIYTMHGPDGTDYPNITTYHEVVENKRLVYDHGATETTPPMFRVTVDFDERDGKTHMEMKMAFVSAEAAQNAKVFIKSAGGNGTWDRLGEFLEEENHKREVFIINRTFDAPIEVLQDLWSKQANARWSRPHLPKSMTEAVTFIAESQSETRVKVEWELAKGSSTAEIAAFVKERGGITQAWNGSFDKLDELLP